MQQTEFARALSNVGGIAIAALFLGGCLESETGDQSSGFIPTNEPPANVAPVISGTPSSNATIGDMYSFLPNASDADGDPLTFLIDNKPTWASFSSDSGELSGRPTLGDIGTYGNILISVSDGTTMTSLFAFSISVADTSTGNSAPRISGSPQTSVVVGTAYAFVPAANDTDGDALTFSITNRPAWASFNATTGELAGTPIGANVGVYTNIAISVSDGQASASLAPFSIEVIDVTTNSAPTISGTPPTAVEAGNAYSFMPTANDADGDTLSFSITNRPAWAIFNASNGLLSGTPSDTDVGVYSGIAISVSDGQASDTLGPFAIEVLEPDTNNAPTISGAPATSVDAGSAYSFTPVADDADGDPLTFSIANRPAWASFDSVTGTLSGTPGQAHVGIYSNIMISVSDGQDSASLAAFTIEVIEVNTAPTISGTPATSVGTGSAYSFTPAANDAEGDVLTFSITNQPAWASFDTATGTLSGTPADTDVGDYANITITVSDGQESAALNPFMITVNPVTLGSVTLSWTPPTRNSDGTVLTDLAGYKLYWGTTPGVYTDSVTINNPGTSSYVIENLQPGAYEFVATALNDAGVESALSNPASTVLNP